MDDVSLSIIGSIARTKQLSTLIGTITVWSATGSCVSHKELGRETIMLIHMVSALVTPSSSFLTYKY